MSLSFTVNWMVSSAKTEYHSAIKNARGFNVLPEVYFSGSENVIEFFEGIDNQIKLLDIPSDLSCAYLKGHLPGTAQDWYQIFGSALVQNTATDFTQLKAALSKAFPAIQNRKDLETRFYASQQRQNQEPTDFVYDLLKLHKKLELGMSEKALVDHIFDLNHKSRITWRNSDNVEGRGSNERKMSNVDNNRGNWRNSEVVRRPSNRRNDYRGNYENSRQGNQWFESRNRFQKDDRRFNDRGYKFGNGSQRDDFSRGDNRNRGWSENFSRGSRKQMGRLNVLKVVELPYVPILINKTFTKALWDTGAEKLLMSEETYQKYFFYKQGRESRSHVITAQEAKYFKGGSKIILDFDRKSLAIQDSLVEDINEDEGNLRVDESETKLNVVANVSDKNPFESIIGEKVNCAVIRDLVFSSREQLIEEQRTDPELGYIHRYLENPEDSSVNPTICPYRVLEVKNNNIVIWKAEKRLTVNVDQVRIYRHRKCDEMEIRTGSSDGKSLRDESSSFDRVQRRSSESQYGRKKGSKRVKFFFENDQGERHTNKTNKRGPLIRSIPSSWSEKKRIKRSKNEIIGYKRSRESGMSGPERKIRKGSISKRNKRTLSSNDSNVLPIYSKTRRTQDKVVASTNRYNLRPTGGRGVPASHGDEDTAGRTSSIQERQRKERQPLHQRANKIRQ
ncbi:uncharacterized protein TNCV_2729281 [Trichonephila clavipes]|nr:uncharacterized protein TNCV_2729281 [Trichonephila clavipes]